MSNKEPGYVYILTNPSFREDWVNLKRTFSPQRRDNWQDVSENKKNIERRFMLRCVFRSTVKKHVKNIS